MTDFDLVSTMDYEGYPTEETEKRIEHYWGGVLEFFAELHKVWHLASWGWSEGDGFRYGRKKENKIRRFHISTAGWSGNEAMISAMQENFFLWHCAWVQERIGGHYIFEVRADDKISSPAEMEEARKRLVERGLLPAEAETTGSRVSEAEKENK